MYNENEYGIDVAKRHFVIVIYGKDYAKLESNTPEGNAKTVNYMQ